MNKDTKIKKPVTAMEVFMSLPDDLLIEMIYKDPEGINIMCMALGIELSNTKFVRDLEAWENCRTFMLQNKGYATNTILKFKQIR